MNETIEQVDRIVELSLLYDFYGELLKEHTRKIFEDYILNDLSLSEIAQEEGISRQGVHDMIKRGSKQLSEYEEKLGLIKKYKEELDTLEKVKLIVGDLCKSQSLNKDHINKLEEVIELVNSLVQ